jgi:hypothetical protein
MTVSSKISLFQATLLWQYTTSEIWNQKAAIILSAHFSDVDKNVITSKAQKQLQFFNANEQRDLPFPIAATEIS